MTHVTPEHLALIAELQTVHERTWGQSALLSCLGRLLSAGPTAAEEVRIHDAWAFDDGFCLVYHSPWGPEVGLRVSETGDQFMGAYVEAPTAADFGLEIADFTVGEPLGRIADNLVYDSSGLGWWGDAPFPLERPPRDGDPAGPPMAR